MSSLGGGSGAPAAPSSSPAASSAQTASPSDPYGAYIAHASQVYNVDPRLIRAVIQTESSGRPKAVSDQGAVGLMQVEPSTAKGMGYKGDLTDPQTNINAGTQYLSQLLDRYGDPQKALMAYHGGFDQRGWGPLTQAYPGKVLTNFNKLPATQPVAPAVQATAPAQQHQDAFDTAMAGVNAPAAPAKTPAAAPGEGMPTAPMHPTTAAQNGSTWSDIAEKGVGNLASSVIGIAGAGARLVGANEFADKAQAARAQIEQQMARDTNNSLAGKAAGVVGGALPYATLGGASIPGAMAGGAVAGAIPAIADNRSGVETTQGALEGAGFGAGGALAARAIGALIPSMSHLVGVSKAADSGAPAGAAASAGGSPAAAAAGARGSAGAAGTSYAQQAAAEGVPDALVQKIAAAEQKGTLNPTSAERHIEAGSLPVPIELTAGQASGDVRLLSEEQNARGKNPELANRFNAQNGQIVDNLTAIRDQVSPNVNVPSGALTGQALVDAYKEMDAPIQRHISDLYAQARGANGAPALVDAAPRMKDFASEIGPTRFNALPSNVQQIFRDAATNQISLPAGFEVNGSSFRPMHVSDLMDIDKTLSGAMRSATDGTVRHDIGLLRDHIVSSDLDPSSAGADAFAAYKAAQGAARARFQAMDADPAYKAAVNDITPPGEPSPLADDFARKYVAGGKTANVQNMLQNLSNDPVNRELVASALMDHLRAQAGIDLRTGTGNVSQAGLNKAIQNLGDKTGIVLGPEAAQTVDKLGNVARYTQQQPRGSYVNNSNTFVASVAGAAKSAAEGAANVAAHGVPVGTWTRQAIERRAAAKEVARSLEPGAGLSAVPLSELMKKSRGTP
ncbi:lytic transglycosylase domain-containing protein [Burkholderia sp. Bp8984]|uniref:lytic transglycosylase domain-containing protein n=1 Tax=Burkholderia sp. Bp8984 TaxID=2184549 RepID=UPI000F5A60EA|nr:lytic transglycosylase domain-containing protein [Burkholderia sp. Bp8984]RQS63832.1 hypothetical protein DID98_02825 [Burkholderia sp. Bp8984]